jgi:hypothetical protein
VWLLLPDLLPRVDIYSAMHAWRQLGWGDAEAGEEGSNMGLCRSLPMVSEKVPRKDEAAIPDADFIWGLRGLKGGGFVGAGGGECAGMRAGS